jgi:hypothetical protein
MKTIKHRDIDYNIVDHTHYVIKNVELNSIGLIYNRKVYGC